MKVLIIGATGLVGWQVFNEAERSFSVAGTYSTRPHDGLLHADVRDAGGILQLAKQEKPDWIIHAAALTNVDYCEDHREEAYAINVRGTEHVAIAAKAVGAGLVYLSTDYVFDGTGGPYREEDKTSPVNYYGLTKLEGERAAARAGKYLVVRSGWIFDFSGDEKNFAFRLVQSLREGKTVHVPYDQFGNPTRARSLARAVLQLIKKDARNVFHVSGSTHLSRSAFAQRLALHFSLDETLIVPVDTETLNQKAKRPKRAGFVVEKVEKVLGTRMESLDEMLGGIHE